MLIGQKEAVQLRIIAQSLLKGFQCEFGDPVILLNHRAIQHPGEDLSEEALHTRGQVYSRMLVDARRDPAVHHPPEELPHGEDQAASLRFPPAEFILGAHVVHGQRAERRGDAVDRDGPRKDHLDGTLDFVFGAFAVAQTQPLRFPGDPHQRAAHERGEARQQIRGHGPEPQLFLLVERVLHLPEAPGHILKLGKFRTVSGTLQGLAVFSQDGVDGV